MLKKLFFSGNRWIVLIASCIINICIGAIYSWSVFAIPMAAHLSAVTGKSITSLAVIFTVANAIGPITMICGGFINKKLGPKLVIIIGGSMYGIGFFLAGFASSVGMLLLTYGIIFGLGLGCVYGCTVSNTVKFFPDKKGLAGGLATAAYGLSSVILPPIADSLITRYTVTNAFIILGITMLIIILFCSLFITKGPDSAEVSGSAIVSDSAASFDSAEVSGSAAPSRSAEVSGSTAPSCGAAFDCTAFDRRRPDFPASACAAADCAMHGNEMRDKNWKQMLAAPYFYIMLAMLCCGAFSGLMITSQASPMAQLIIKCSSSEAAVIVSILALFNVGGRILSGFLYDRLGATPTLRIIFLILIGSLALLFIPLADRSITFCIGIMLTGLGFGAIMGVFPGFTTSRFGTKNNNVNYGIIFCGFALAGIVSPTAASIILDLTGTYQLSFIISGVLAVTGLALTFIKERKHVS